MFNEICFSCDRCRYKWQTLGVIDLSSTNNSFNEASTLPACSMEFFEMPVIGSALVEKVVNYSGRAFTSTGTDAYMLALTDSGIVFPRKPTRNRIRRHTKCRTLSPSRGGLRLCVIRRQPRRQALQLTLECTYLTPPLNAAETTGGIEMQLLPKASDDCMLSRTFC